MSGKGLPVDPGRLDVAELAVAGLAADAELHGAFPGGVSLSLRRRSVSRSPTPAATSCPFPYRPPSPVTG